MEENADGESVEHETTTKDTSTQDLETSSLSFNVEEKEVGVDKQEELDHDHETVTHFLQIKAVNNVCLFFFYYRLIHYQFPTSVKAILMQLHISMAAFL